MEGTPQLMPNAHDNLPDPAAVLAETDGDPVAVDPGTPLLGLVPPSLVGRGLDVTGRLPMTTLVDFADAALALALSAAARGRPELSAFAAIAGLITRQLVTNGDGSAPVTDPRALAADSARLREMDTVVVGSFSVGAMDRLSDGDPNRITPAIIVTGREFRDPDRSVQLALLVPPLTVGILMAQLDKLRDTVDETVRGRINAGWTTLPTIARFDVE